MLELQTLQTSPKKILNKLKDFENFCLGTINLSPEEFKKLNMELSIGAIFHIGKRRFLKNEDGKHLLWTGLDKQEYDLGPIHKLNIFRTGPGFHRGSTFSLDNDSVTKNEIMEIPGLKKQISIVTLKNGSVGVGPNYKIALRNAAIKSQLKNAFKFANPPDAWKEHYGNA